MWSRQCDHYIQTRCIEPIQLIQEINQRQRIPWISSSDPSWLGYVTQCYVRLWNPRLTCWQWYHLSKTTIWYRMCEVYQVEWNGSNKHNPLCFLNQSIHSQTFWLLWKPRMATCLLDLITGCPIGTVQNPASFVKVLTLQKTTSLPMRLEQS